MFATKQQRTLRGAPATLQSIGYDLITKITLSLRGGTTRQSQDANVTHKKTPVIAREVRPRQSVQDYGIFRRLPQSSLLRNDAVLN